MINLGETGRSLSSRYLSSLHYPEFRKLWVATISSQSSAWALIVARAALVLHITERAEWTGYVTFAAMIPSIVVTPFAGFLADRFDRRKVLAFAYAINLGHNLLLAVLVASGSINEWQVLLLAILNGCARAIQMPAAQALLPNTVPRERIINAVSLYQATQHGSRFVGPFLILVVLWITGHEEWVFFLCAGLYAVGLSSILSIRTASRGVVESGKGMGLIFRNVAVGLNYMYHNPLVLSLILLVVTHCGMVMSFESLFPVLSGEKLGMEGAAGILRGSGYLMAGYGAAALVAALGLAGIESERTRGQVYLWFGVLSGITAVALALSPNLPLAMIAVAAMGFSQGGFMTIHHSMLQTIAPDAIRGRLLAVNTWHVQGFMASFNLVNATLVGFSALTGSVILGAGGVAFMVVMAGSIARLPLRQVYSRGLPEELVAAYR